ncbi:hypothetical protein ACHAXT_003451 [Thalassiosira profunda]
MKRPRPTDGASGAGLHAVVDDAAGADGVEAARKAYKWAKKAHRRDRSNDELKRARDDAKRALQEAEAKAAVGATAEDDSGSSSEAKEVAIAVTPPDNNSASTPPDLPALEAAYRSALAAFKADKSDKDLRRAKTAARRALDDARAATGDGTQLVCTDCSQKFLFSTEDQEKHAANGWTEPPKRCPGCREARNARADARERGRGTAIDGSKRNMCYAFQRGECPHGRRCRFSHNPEGGGKRSNMKVGSGRDEADGGISGKKEEEERRGDGGVAAKERKEDGLRKKGKKGANWRNKL